jgi:hypothetical protein
MGYVDGVYFPPPHTDARNYSNRQQRKNTTNDWGMNAQYQSNRVYGVGFFLPNRSPRKKFLPVAQAVP